VSELDLDRLRSWEGREESSEDVISLTPVRALAATLDLDPGRHVDGGILPPLYHWLYFPQLATSGDLAADGHAKKGGFMPPVPFPRRMFAGARVEFPGELRIGERVRRVSRIKAVRYKEGRSGPLVFVTVGYEISNDDGVQLVEEQDIAYRPASAAGPPSSAREAAAPAADFSRVVDPDERLLFRFSALTFNAHRIHYDLPYARGEGYPALVIHGPLTAVLLADLVARECGQPRLRHFSFRARNAFFLGDRIRLVGKRVEDAVELTAVGEEGAAGLSARAVLR
jgi:3-methylfumaryl-CoA hydratase